MHDRECFEASPNEIRSDYFQWLCGIVHADDPDCSFYSLMRALFNQEFVYFVNNDDNRAADGVRLRYAFAVQTPYIDCSCLYQKPCNVLEMMIALAGRIDEDIMWNPTEGDRTVVWFWEMIQNLGLDPYDDEHYAEPESYNRIVDIVDIFINRLYRPDGLGGLFPLKKTSEDQRNVEIWYQMNAYFLENYGVEEDLEDVV